MRVTGSQGFGQVRILVRLCAALAAIVLIPAIAHAQTSITGTIRDASGAVLPGVTVEAASPVLIEKVRSTISDGSGQYRLTELLPGTYTITMTLPGFTTVKREGVEVSGVGVMTINGDMRVGGVQETITVTGENADRRRAEHAAPAGHRRRHVESAPGHARIQRADLPRALGHRRHESDRHHAGDAHLLQPRRPRQRGPHLRRWSQHRIRLQRWRRVGLHHRHGQLTGDAADALGGLGETEMGGTLVNFIPKTGGNAFSGSFFGSTAGEWSQGNNIDDRLKSLGLSQPAALYKNWDGSASVGGPFKKDKLWFFANYRDFRHPRGHSRDVREQERGQPELVDVRA
jgi:hypothetical protein